MEDESFKASPQEKRLKILANDEIKSIGSSLLSMRDRKEIEPTKINKCV
jgi:hypothetical protein